MNALGIILSGADCTTGPNLWSPAMLGANLVLHYKAGVNTTSASNRVSAIAPATTGAGPTLVQATSGNQPLLRTQNGVACISDDTTAYGSSSEGLAGTNTITLHDTDTITVLLFAKYRNLTRYGFTGLFGLGLANAGGVGLMGGWFPQTGSTEFWIGLGNQFTYYGTGDIREAVVAAFPAPADGTVVNYAFTFDGTGKFAGISAYSGGASQALTNISDLYTLGTANLSAGQVTLLGNGTNVTPDYLFEVVVANRALTSAEIAAANQYFTQQLS